MSSLPRQPDQPPQDDSPEREPNPRSEARGWDEELRQDAIIIALLRSGSREQENRGAVLLSERYAVGLHRRVWRSLAGEADYMVAGVITEFVVNTIAGEPTPSRPLGVHLWHKLRDQMKSAHRTQCRNEVRDGEYVRLNPLESTREDENEVADARMEMLDLYTEKRPRDAAKLKAIVHDGNEYVATPAERQAKRRALKKLWGFFDRRSEGEA